MLSHMLYILTFLCASGLWAAPELTVTGDPDFHETLFSRLEPLTQTVGGPLPLGETIASGLYASDFQPFPPRLSIMVNHSTQWYRIRLNNRENRPVNMIWYNTFPVYEVKVISSSDPKRIIERGYAKSEEREYKDYFPYGSLQVPPGESQVYIGVNTGDIPFSLVFEMRSPENFDRFWFGRTIFVAAIFGGLISLFLYMVVFYLTVGVRYYLYFIIMSASYLLLEGMIAGVFCKIPFGIQPYSLGQYWHVSSLVCIVFVYLMTMEYFDMTRKRMPVIYRLFKAMVVMNILMVPLFHFYRSIALVWITFSLIAMVFLAALVMGAEYKKNPRYVGEFGVAWGPVIVLNAMFVVAVNGTTEHIFAFHILRMLAAIFNYIASSLLLGARYQKTQREHALLETSLKSVVSTNSIQTIIQSGKSIDTRPVNRRVTIMFIDIVGYSLSARRMLPEENFVALKAVLHQLTQVIHKYDGVIDKSLGDGCLCFFGYDLVGGSRAGHEQTAVDCALEIQRRVAAKIIDDGNKGIDFVFPLRIGINTAEVCIGNMGDESRFDFTMTGDGVVMANRFESACEPFKIIIGTSTFAGLPEDYRNAGGIFMRLVTVKHQRQLEDSFEFNPFEQDPASLAQARRIFWQTLSITKQYDRFVPENEKIYFDSVHGRMDVLNFSYNGYCLRSSQYLGKGVHFDLELTPIKHDEKIALISPVSVEVAWGVPDKDGGFQIGVKISSLNGAQRDLLLAILRREFNHEQKPRIVSAA